MRKPLRVHDITSRVDPEKLGRPAAEMAVFDEIAPTRIGFFLLSRFTDILDVRILGGDEGFAVASAGHCFIIEYTTVLDDGFVVSTTNVRPEDTRRGLATLLFAPRVDAGARVVREKSPKAAFDRHVAFVRKITEARRTAVRQNQDKSLYFEFRLARNRGIRRLGVVQIAIGVVAATIFFAVIAVTRHKSPALLLASPIFLLFCWLGGFLHAWIRRTKPLLAPRAKS